MTFNGTLRRNPVNPRYFTDDSGKAIYLTGSHNWFVQQDYAIDDGEWKVFDYTGYLEMMSGHHHNFMRYWLMSLQASGVGWTEQLIHFDPLPYARTGHEPALDGKPKFDLDQWNEAYFARLRERVVQAAEHGIYAAIVMFDGCSMKNSDAPWAAHPYNKANNINGVDGGQGNVFTLDIRQVVEREEAFIRKVIECVNDLDNVIYEIVNEVQNEYASKIWQMHLVDYIRKVEQDMPRQHPVGITAVGAEENNELLLESNADWISPGIDYGLHYRHNPPAADGRKVVLLDTDHICALSVMGDRRWIWKSFTRGYNPILMDPWETLPGEMKAKNAGWSKSGDEPVFVDARQAMGHTKKLADRVDMNRMLPCGELASSAYCLADPGSAYIVYVPEGREVGVDLSPYDCEFRYEWLNLADGGVATEGTVRGGTRKIANVFRPPYEGDAVLFIYAA